MARFLNRLVLDGRGNRHHSAVMSRAFIFWVLMLLWLVFGLIVPHWGQGGNGLVSWAGAGGLLEFILFGLLGWNVFGKPIHE